SPSPLVQTAARTAGETHRAGGGLVTSVCRQLRKRRDSFEGFERLEPFELFMRRETIRRDKHASLNKTSSAVSSGAGDGQCCRLANGMHGGSDLFDPHLRSARRLQRKPRLAGGATPRCDPPRKLVGTVQRSTT